MFVRNCPKCGKELEYKSEGSLRHAINKNNICRECAEDGRRKKITDGLKLAYKEGRRKMDVSNEVREKIRNTLLGNIPWNKGLTKDMDNRLDYGRTKEYIKYKCKTCNNQIENLLSKYKKKKHRIYCNVCWDKILNRKMPTPFFGQVPWNKGLTKYDDDRLKRSEEVCKKIRLTTLKNIEDKCGQVMPNYNKSIISILEQKAKELGIDDLQHAENGGEFFLAELGYYVDGFSKKTNTWFEYYEKAHKYKKERDERRKKEIINHLKCEFIEIKQLENN